MSCLTNICVEKTTKGSDVKFCTSGCSDVHPHSKCYFRARDSKMIEHYKELSISHWSAGPNNTTINMITWQAGI